MKRIKRKTKIILLIAGGIAICGIVATIVFLLNKSHYSRPSYNPVATIELTEYLGPDAGSAYVYDIYSTTDSGSEPFFYIKSSYASTVAGIADKKDIDSGEIKTRNDLLKIQEELKKDHSKHPLSASTYYNYIYKRNEPHDNCNDIDDLANKLFAKDSR